MASQPEIELRPMEGNGGAENDHALEPRPLLGGDGIYTRAPRADTGRMQAVREAGARAEQVRERLDAQLPSQAANAPIEVHMYLDIPAVQDAAAVNGIYGHTPAENFAANYEGMGEPLGDPVVLPNAEMEKLKKYAEGKRQELADALRDLQAERDLHARNLAEHHRIVEDARKTAQAELEASRKSKNKYRTATIALGVTTSLIAISSIIFGLLWGKVIPNNIGPDGSLCPDPFELNPFLANGFVAGIPAQADVLRLSRGVLAGSLAIVGADPKTATLTVLNEGVWSIDKDSKIIFTPAKGFDGNPTPQEFTAISAIDAKNIKKAGIVLLYDGDFRIDSIIQTTFVKGKSATVAFLKDAVGADADSAKLVGADAGSNDLKKTVANEGVWTLNKAAKTIDFTPNAGFMNEPGAIEFTVAAAKNSKRIAQGSILLVDQVPSVPDQVIKAAPGQALTVPAFAVPGIVFDAKSLTIRNGASTAKQLAVPAEGTWSIDTDGVLSFKPEANFKQLPSPINLVIKDQLGREDAFLLTAVPLNAPFALNEFQTPANPIAQMGGVTIICAAAKTAIKGDAAVDLKTVKIIGLAPFDDTLPSATYTTPNAVLNVPGEGVWNVNADGTITFTFAANPARWPTPIAYSVKDVDGRESNVALIWITPNEMTAINVALAGVNGTSDDDFWTRYHDNVLVKQVTLSELISATYLIERSAVLAVPTADMRTINGLAVFDNELITETEKVWAKRFKAAPAGLADVTKFINNAYVNARADVAKITRRIGDIPLATRIIRLQMIRALLNKILSGRTP